MNEWFFILVFKTHKWKCWIESSIWGMGGFDSWKSHPISDSHSTPKKPRHWGVWSFSFQKKTTLLLPEAHHPMPIQLLEYTDVLHHIFSSLFLTQLPILTAIVINHTSNVTEIFQEATSRKSGLYMFICYRRYKVGRIRSTFSYATENWR